MAKKSKLKTPDWMKEGFDSPEDYAKSKGLKEKKKGKVFKIRECPECHSDDVGVVLSNSDAEQGGGKEWECRKCKWAGKNVEEKELSEEEFLKYTEGK